MAETTPAATRILLVDDYIDALEVWALYLEAVGFVVTTASDGEQAIAAATTHPPDLAVVDLQLPGVSGFDVARTLRANQQTSTLPLIALTGRSTVRDADDARAAGFDGVLIKPCEPQALIDEIGRVLQSRPTPPPAP